MEVGRVTTARVRQRGPIGILGPKGAVGGGIPGRIGGLLLGLAVAVGPLATPGAASNWGGPKDAGRDCDTTYYSQCVANGWHHTVNYSSTLTQAYRDAFPGPAGAYTTGPGMLVSLDAAYAADNDVRAAQVSDSSVGYWGWTRCSSAAVHGTLAGPPPLPTWTNGMEYCYPQLLYLNDYFRANYPDGPRKEALVCHELGHTMGLAHRSTTPLGCMRNPPIVSSTTFYNRPQGHDIMHLEYFYWPQ